MATIVSTPAGVRATGPSPCVFFGVDVASSHLDICSYGASAVQRIANTPSAIASWLGSLPAGSTIAMESTGSYHRTLATDAFRAGFAVYLLNPHDPVESKAITACA